MYKCYILLLICLTLHLNFFSDILLVSLTLYLKFFDLKISNIYFFCNSIMSLTLELEEDIDS